MLGSRALGVATVMVLVGWGMAGRLEAQENLDAGKSASQIFAGTCAACHKSPRGLLRTVSPASLTGFLREHYTTSAQMAGVLASYLISSGAQSRSAAGTRPAPAPGAPGIFGAPGTYSNQLARPALAPGTARPAAERQSKQRRGKPAPTNQAAEPTNGAPGGESSKAGNKTDGAQDVSGGKPAEIASPEAPASASAGGGSQPPAATPEPASPPVSATAQPPDTREPAGSR